MKIKAVNAQNANIQALLQWLQLEILPSDVPHDVSHGYWWIAYDDGHPVAFAGLVHSSRYYDVGYLCRSGVLPMYRGHGLQKKLVRVREKKARLLGWKYLITDTKDNPPSANSLIRCGYQTFTPSYKWALDGAIYWRKKIGE